MAPLLPPAVCNYAPDTIRSVASGSRCSPASQANHNVSDGVYWECEPLLKGAMPQYRVYLRDHQGIAARDDFLAEDDVMATQVAAALLDATCDQCSSYELWQGDRKVARDYSRPLTAARIREKAQAIAIEREEILQRSAWTIAKSERLLKRLAGIKGND